MILIDGGGFSALSPAQRAAAAGAVEVTIERIQQIANTQVAAMAENARAEEQAFRNLDVSTSAFSQVPEAQALGEQHRAAQQVFAETIKGILADLEEFRDALVMSARAHESTDDAAYAALTSLGSRYTTTGTLHSEASYDGERAEQGGALRGLRSESGDSAPDQPDQSDQSAQSDQSGQPASTGDTGGETGFLRGSGAQDA